MSNIQARFASAFFVGILATLPLPTVFDGAAHAADDCMAEPNGQTPQGKHWYYRIERGTGRHCWYVRGEDEPARAAASESTTPIKTTSRNADMLAPRSIADARAEWPARPAVAQNGPAAAPRVVPPAGDITGTAPPNTSPNNSAQTPAASPWPDPSTVVPKLGPPPETTAAAADEQATPPTSAPVPPPPAQTAMPTDRNMGSLQKLLLVAFGALALAGLSGSAVYRLAGVRHRARMRQDRWPARKVQQIAADAPVPPWAEPKIGRATQPHDPTRARVETETVETETVEIETVEVENAEMDHAEIDSADDRVERIEDYLARLTRQLQAEMEAPRQRPRQERQRAAN
jgi:hypothetical protein